MKTKYNFTKAELLNLAVRSISNNDRELVEGLLPPITSKDGIIFHGLVVAQLEKLTREEKLKYTEKELYYLYEKQHDIIVNLKSEQEKKITEQQNKIEELNNTSSEQENKIIELKSKTKRNIYYISAAASIAVLLSIGLFLPQNMSLKNELANIETLPDTIVRVDTVTQVQEELIAMANSYTFDPAIPKPYSVRDEVIVKGSGSDYKILSKHESFTNTLYLEIQTTQTISLTLYNNEYKQILKKDFNPDDDFKIEIAEPLKTSGLFIYTLNFNGQDEVFYEGTIINQ